MAPSRRSLLDLMEEMYGTRHPDFNSIRWQFERIRRRVQKKSMEKDAKLLLAGVYAAKHTYEDWGELDDYERENALMAIEEVRDTTLHLLNRHDIEIEVH